MIKTKIIETTEKYYKDGKLVEKITRETTTESDENAITTSGAIWFDEQPKIVPQKSCEIRNGTAVFTNPPISQCGSDNKNNQNYAQCSCNHAVPID